MSEPNKLLSGVNETINFDRAKLERFRNAYTNAKARNDDQFTFEGHEFFVPYARYLIEYLEEQFK